MSIKDSKLPWEFAVCHFCEFSALLFGDACDELDLDPDLHGSPHDAWSARDRSNAVLD